MKGNKGEWSELYVLLRLLAYGRLYAADENVNKLEDVYFPILKILRNERQDKKLEYHIEEREIELFLNDSLHRKISRDRLQSEAILLYQRILAGENRAFEIQESEDIISELECERLAAPSTDKTDISMQVHDIHTGFDPICGFSIKSELGNAPTLLNASKATNFVYKINNISDEEIDRINAIDTKNKIMDRLEAIKNISSLEFVRANSDTFASNLMLIDSRMEEIISVIILEHYMTGENNCKKIIESIETRNPLNFPRAGFYEYKFKKMLCSVALGMVPSKEWDGQDDANGGYIIVKHDGEVLAYHLYNRNYFEKYLLDNTKFERASTSRHEYATIYKVDGDAYINLNLQIRFV